jgi:hypothetical protein
VFDVENFGSGISDPDFLRRIPCGRWSAASEKIHNLTFEISLSVSRKKTCISSKVTDPFPKAGFHGNEGNDQSGWLHATLFQERSIQTRKKSDEKWETRLARSVGFMRSAGLWPARTLGRPNLFAWITRPMTDLDLRFHQGSEFPHYHE